MRAMPSGVDSADSAATTAVSGSDMSGRMKETPTWWAYLLVRKRGGGARVTGWAAKLGRLLCWAVAGKDGPRGGTEQPGTENRIAE